MSEPHCILIIRFSSLGDLILTSPVLRELRRQFPDSHITLLTSEGFGRILANNPNVDQTIYHPRQESLPQLGQLIKRLKNQRFDLVYDAHDSVRSKLVRWILRLFRPSMKCLVIDKHSRQRVNLIRHKRHSQELKLSQRSRLLQPLGQIANQPLQHHTELYPSAKDEQYVQQWLKQQNLKDAPILAIGPSASFDLKKWPLEYFDQLVRELSSKSLNILLVGGPNEPETTAIYQRFSTHICNAAGQFSPIQTAALLKKCALVICNDTSISHMAEAMGTPCLVLFGPTVREFGYAPYLSNSLMLETDLPCRPCSRNGKGKCRITEYKLCLKGIPVQRVLDEVSGRVMPTYS